MKFTAEFSNNYYQTCAPEAKATDKVVLRVLPPFIVDRRNKRSVIPAAGIVSVDQELVCIIYIFHITEPMFLVICLSSVDLVSSYQFRFT